MHEATHPPAEDPDISRIADVPGEHLAQRVVTAALALIAALTFAFSFGNVWALALRLGVSPLVAPLVAPAVDLSVVGLLIGIRHLSLRGVSHEELRPARCLLVFSGLATLALNVAEPIAQGAYGRATFDAVGPLLLIGWSEVGPGLLGSMNSVRTRTKGSTAAESRSGVDSCHEPFTVRLTAEPGPGPDSEWATPVGGQSSKRAAPDEPVRRRTPGRPDVRTTSEIFAEAPTRRRRAPHAAWSTSFR
jgi:hypothetical protein